MLMDGIVLPLFGTDSVLRNDVILTRETCAGGVCCHPSLLLYNVVSVVITDL